MRVGLALAIALLEPVAEVAWNCRAGFESSEACVWGKSLIVLHFAVSMVVVLPIAFVLLLAAEYAWRRYRTGPATQ